MAAARFLWHSFAKLGIFETNRIKKAAGPGQIPDEPSTPEEGGNGT